MTSHHLIEIINTTRVPLNRAALRRQTGAMLSRLSVKKRMAFTVVFVAAAAIRALKKRYFHRGGLTDIITLSYAPAAGLPPGHDIFIAPGQVRRQARALRVRFSRELLFVIAHGLLHCLGCDDKTERARAAMYAKQEALITSL